MAEDEAIFDPTLLKKKKKKKKSPFDLDAALEGESTPSEPTPAVAQETVDPAPEEIVPEKKEDDLELDMEELSLKKKKKKKKKTVIMDDVGDTIEEMEGNKENAPDASSEAPAADDDTVNMEFTGKKKRRKKKDGKDHSEPSIIDTTGGDNISKDTSGTAWAGTERDYTYEELLTRAFDIMRAKNPDMATGEKKRFVMRPPQVVRVGTKKTSFVNFSDMCKMLHRPPEHLLAFLLAELGTSGSIDGHNQLIIKGRFQQKQIENVLRRYIKEYVTCHTCRSSDTFLHKENRLFFLQCERCQSRCSVQSIKSGFQAVTGKRAQLRAKAN
ncbi:eukaryotic translation initiation factor 2 subunit 2-like [Anneissia japonica]|uniref:eukaryotic translation initiation factor 2 subunit 2-like n=1 Tax=Anneissia japonica TaxID=1529436 RepID=UPI0014257487|nr:eukaryotic translation initiation factor 2 subunit 2-like [Anneissia japonica]